MIEFVLGAAAGGLLVHFWPAIAAKALGWLK